jgi:hypothetical protein
MELHELPHGNYETMSEDAKKAADEATGLAINLGEMIFQTAATVDNRPPVIGTALVYALLRTASEAGKSPEGARSLIQHTIDRLTKSIEPGNAMDSMWHENHKRRGHD